MFETDLDELGRTGGLIPISSCILGLLVALRLDFKDAIVYFLVCAAVALNPSMFVLEDCEAPLVVWCWTFWASFITLGAIGAWFSLLLADCE